LQDDPKGDAMEDRGKPRRLAEADQLEQQLIERAGLRVQHNRRASGSHSEPQGDRTLKGTLEVQLWQEMDGSESVVVTGGPSLNDLEMKGLLHDAVYVMAHRGEEGFITGNQ
jgi:hypothetical protein